MEENEGTYLRHIGWWQVRFLLLTISIIEMVHIYNIRRASTRPIGPTPGPPPPCGMQKVLCKLRWQTSAPISPGLTSPTCTRDKRANATRNTIFWEALF